MKNKKKEMKTTPPRLLWIFKTIIKYLDIFDLFNFFSAPVHYFLLASGIGKGKENREMERKTCIKLSGFEWEYRCFLKTFQEYPPRMKAAAFNLDNVMDKLSDPGNN